MFWRSEPVLSPLQQLLEQEEVILTELLDEEDVLQECKAQNQRLLRILTSDSAMLELLHLITHEPPAGGEEALRYKHANIACELLTCDVSEMNDKMGGDENLLNTLYHFLEQAPPLNPLLASFFSKTFTNLISCKTPQVLRFVQAKGGFIRLLLTHLEASAMMDLLLRLISSVETPALRQGVLIWLNEEKLIQRLIDLIHPNINNERQSNASQTLCDVIHLCREQARQLPENSEPNPLLTTLESQECVAALLKNMFSGDLSEVCVVNGTQVLLVLLEPPSAGLEGMEDEGSEGPDNSPILSSCISQAIQPHLQDYHQLLLNPPTRCSMLTSLGVLEVPFGKARLHGAKLLHALLLKSEPNVTMEICHLGTINLLLDLFFTYPWNNFLHTQVELCVCAILRHPPRTHTHTTPPHTPNKPDGDTHTTPPHTDQSAGEPLQRVHAALLDHLFQSCQLLQRILGAWDQNDKIQSEGGMRRGYMGHLTRVANAVTQSLEEEPTHKHISQLINDLPPACRTCWETFVSETLPEINQKNTVDMSGPEHRLQQSACSFADRFGFNDEDFPVHDGKMKATFGPAGMNFSLDPDIADANVFGRRVQQPPTEEDEDIWEEKEVDYNTHKARDRFGVLGAAAVEQRQHQVMMPAEVEGHTESSSSTEEKDYFPESPGWTARFEAAGVVAVDTGSGVWGAASALSESEQRGWATFPELQPFCCSDTGPRCRSPETAEGQTKQEENRCVWGGCIARTTPLVTSHSSSSSGSDNEDEENKHIVTDTGRHRQFHGNHQTQHGYQKLLNHLSKLALNCEWWLHPLRCGGL